MIEEIDITNLLEIYGKKFGALPPLFRYTANEFQDKLRHAIETGKPLKEETDGR